MEIPKYIYHYYEKKNGPFLNISALEYEEAKTILRNVKKGFNAKRSENYIDKRLALEARLKKSFLERGGNPRRSDPFYFTLGPCDWMLTWFEETEVIKVPLDMFKGSDSISFTYPDSMISHQVHDREDLKIYRKPCNGKVFLMDELEDLIREYGLPSEENWSTVKENFYDRYIEVQVWGELGIRIRFL